MYSGRRVARNGVGGVGTSECPGWSEALAVFMDEMMMQFENGSFHKKKKNCVFHQLKSSL